MNRYLRRTTDKAKQLEEWIKELARETNIELKNSELHNINLNIRDPFEYRGEKHNNGFVGMNIKFDSKEPNFLNEGDRDSWQERMRELRGERFGLEAINFERLSYATIDFKEPTEEELYILTPKKELTIRDGFDRVKGFAKWYCSAVSNYGNVIQSHEERMGQYLEDLKTLN